MRSKASKKSGCKGKGGKPVKKQAAKPVKKQAPPAVRQPNVKKRGIVDELVEKVVCDSETVCAVESSNVEICENCGDPFDSDTAVLMFCPECGILGTDQCCMGMGEDEPCRLCRDGGEGDDEDSDDLDDGNDDLSGGHY